MLQERVRIREALRRADGEPVYMRLTSQEYLEVIDRGGGFVGAPKQAGSLDRYSLWQLLSRLREMREKQRSRELGRLEREGWLAVGVWHELPDDLKDLKIEQPLRIRISQIKRLVASGRHPKRILDLALQVAATTKADLPDRYFYHRLERIRLDHDLWDELPRAAKERLKTVGEQLEASAAWSWAVCDIPGCDRFTFHWRNNRACQTCRRRLPIPKQRTAVRSSPHIEGDDRLDKDDHQAKKRRGDLTRSLARYGIPLVPPGSPPARARSRGLRRMTPEEIARDDFSNL